MTQIVITRNEGVDRFCIVNKDGSHTPTDIKGSVKAGDAARMIARRNPGAQIGVLASTFGPETQRIYGEVVWMRRGFEKEFP